MLHGLRDRSKTRRPTGYIKTMTPILSAMLEVKIWTALGCGQIIIVRIKHSKERIKFGISY